MPNKKKNTAMKSVKKALEIAEKRNYTDVFSFFVLPPDENNAKYSALLCVDGDAETLIQCLVNLLRTKPEVGYIINHAIDIFEMEESELGQLIQKNKNNLS